VETYAAERGWKENKMVGMAAIGLPDDKVEFLLTVPEGDQKDWPKLKKQSSPSIGPIRSPANSMA